MLVFVMNLRILWILFGSGLKDSERWMDMPLNFILNLLTFQAYSGRFFLHSKCISLLGFNTYFITLINKYYIELHYIFIKEILKRKNKMVVKSLDRYLI